MSADLLPLRERDRAGAALGRLWKCIFLDLGTSNRVFASRAPGGLRLVVGHLSLVESCPPFPDVAVIAGSTWYYQLLR